MLLRHLRERFITHLIGDYVPVLNLVRRPAPWPTLDALLGYPEPSLGRQVAEFLYARGLPFKVRYENHDAIHALLGYETNITGEMEVQAFLWANRSSSPAGCVLFLVGGLLLPEQWEPMRRAYIRGRSAAPIEEARLPFRLFEAFRDVQARFEPRRAREGRRAAPPFPSTDPRLTRRSGMLSASRAISTRVSSGSPAAICFSSVGPMRSERSGDF
jgi:hypothetical protein